MNLKLAALGALLLGGCTLIPDYMRPELPASAQWPGKEATVDANAPTAADIAWKDFFRSPGLQQVVETALAHNRDLRIAALNVQAARALYRVQRADLFPTLDASITGSKQHLPDNASNTSTADTTGSYSAGISSTSFELDLFGRVRSLNEAAFQDYLASAKARDAVKISLIGEVANAYLQWLADQKLLAITQDTLNAQERSHHLVSQRFEAGIANRLELAQAQTTLETARSNLALYTRYEAQDRNALILLMGVKDSADALPTGDTLNDIVLLKALPVGLPSTVLLARPDVAQAEHTLKAYNADIGAARANFFPRITLTGSFGFASRSLSDLFGSGSGGAWAFAPQAVMPIFDTGRNFAGLDYSKAQRDAAVASYERSVQSAFREVADALVARRTLADQLAAQDRLVTAAQSAYDLSNARYQSGIDSFLSVLDAQRALYQAQQGTVEIERQTLSNYVDLYKALGGGLAKPAATPTPALTTEEPAPKAKETLNDSRV